MLLAAIHLCADAGFRQGGLDGFENLADALATIAARGLDRFRDHREAVRIQVRQAQVLQFPINLIETKTMRDRRMDVEGLARDAPPLRALQRRQRTHVVQSIRQLDQHDAHIARHRQQHLAEILGLRVFLALEFDFVELGNTIHKFGDGGAESCGDMRLGDSGVLDNIMQQCGQKGLHIELPGRANRRHGQRMGDVFLAAGTHLAQMRRLAERERLDDPINIGWLQVGRQAGGERIELRRLGGHLTRPVGDTRRRQAHARLRCFN